MTRSLAVCSSGLALALCCVAGCSKNGPEASSPSGTVSIAHGGLTATKEDALRAVILKLNKKVDQLATAVDENSAAIEILAEQLTTHIAQSEQTSTATGEAIMGLASDLQDLQSQVADLSAAVAEMPGDPEQLGVGAYDANGQFLGSVIDYTYQPYCPESPFPPPDSCGSFAVVLKEYGIKVMLSQLGGWSNTVYYKFPNCQGPAYFSDSYNNWTAFDPIAQKILVIDAAFGQMLNVSYASKADAGGACVNQVGKMSGFVGKPLTPPFNVPLALPLTLK